MFFITCFERVETDKLGWPDTGDCRTFGFVESFEEAEQALNENWCDMHECLYRYALVEEMLPMIHPDVLNRWFFEWDNNMKGFFQKEEPDELQVCCNFALG